MSQRIVEGSPRRRKDCVPEGSFRKGRESKKKETMGFWKIARGYNKCATVARSLMDSSYRTYNVYNFLQRHKSFYNRFFLATAMPVTSVISKGWMKERTRTRKYNMDAHAHTLYKDGIIF